MRNLQSLPQGWRKVKLGSLLKEPPQYGYTANAQKNKVGPKFLRITDIQGHIVNWEEVPYCKIKESEKEKYLLRQGDLLFARTGASTGMNYFVKLSPPEESIFASYLIRIKTDYQKCIPEYLSYFFRSFEYWGQINSFLAGSAQPGINATILQELKIPLPENITEQKRIAEILSAFDDKIELNNKIIKTLEQMAQEIFKEWFVRFNFPVEFEVKSEKLKVKNLGYKDAGGKFVDSELGKIPEGWEVKKLGEILTLEYGKALTAANRKSGIIPVYASSGIVGYHNEKLVSGPGIVVGRAGVPGSIHWSQTDFYCVDSAFYVGTSISKYFVYYLLKYQNLESLISGSAVPGLNRNMVYLNFFILPRIDIINKFEEIIKPIFLEVYRLTVENQKLASLRDLLLPKLMSGEILVNSE